MQIENRGVKHSLFMDKVNCLVEIKQKFFLDLQSVDQNSRSHTIIKHKAASNTSRPRQAVRGQPQHCPGRES